MRGACTAQPYPGYEALSVVGLVGKLHEGARRAGRLWLTRHHSAVPGQVPRVTGVWIGDLAVGSWAALCAVLGVEGKDYGPISPYRKQPVSGEVGCHPPKDTPGFWGHYEVVTYERSGASFCCCGCC